MLPRFFIDRPIFAWVIAIFIVLAGVVAITQLPITQYPKVAPPTVTVNVTYPGASAQQIEESVLELIEREINGTPKMIYMEAAALANGTGSLTISFEPGTDGDQAQIEVQNRVARVQSRLPASVTQNGVRVDQSRSNFLMIVGVETKNVDDLPAVADYASRSIMPELQRMGGVGQVQLFAAERAMRMLDAGARREDVAAEVFSYLSRAVAHMVADAHRRTRLDSALISGGVASSGLLRELRPARLSRLDCPVSIYWGRPELSGDNACGVALIGWEEFYDGKHH